MICCFSLLICGGETWDFSYINLFIYLSISIIKKEKKKECLLLFCSWMTKRSFQTPSHKNFSDLSSYPKRNTLQYLGFLGSSVLQMQSKRKLLDLLTIIIFGGIYFECTLFWWVRHGTKEYKITYWFFKLV